ncbi:MAG TPA: hypothetical protein VFC19_06385 [Candidatus Limnocylindrales bacterium]|nr:hypothetical protein [Candidatus Limnocylindrales bacterium]
MTPWPYNDRPADFSLPDFGLSPEDHQSLTDDIWQSLLKGYDDPDDFIESYLDEDFPLSEEEVRTAFDLMLQVRLVQQAQWTAEETTTNLDRAFEELEEAGIVARQNFACCMNCGSSEIFDERDDSREWRGYVFFHEQDTDRLIENGSVYLAYGAFSQTDLPQMVETDILPALIRHGLRPDWDGDVNTRIRVDNAQWYAACLR